MSDANLRELERRWRETGSVEDEAAWLLERVRVGDLTRERAELAAYLGHGPAAQVVGEPAPPAPQPFWRSAIQAGWVDLTNWLYGLGNWGREVRVRACLVMGSLEDPACEYLPDLVPVWDRSFAALEDWVVAPSPSHEEALRMLAPQAQQALWPLYDPRDTPPPPEDPDPVLAAVIGFLTAGEPLSEVEPRDWYISAVDLPGTGPEDVVRDALARELVPWALGYGDPVRERVEARQRAEAAGE